MGRKRRQTAWLSQFRDDDPDFPLPTETQGDGKKEEKRASTAPTGGRLPHCVGAARSVDSVDQSWVGMGAKAWLSQITAGKRLSPLPTGTPRPGEKREVCKYWRNGGMPSVLSKRRRVGEKMDGSRARWRVGARLWICGSTMAETRLRTAWLSQMRDSDPHFPLPTETQGVGKRRSGQVLPQRGDAFRTA